MPAPSRNTESRPVTESLPVYDLVIAGAAASGLALAAAVEAGARRGDRGRGGRSGAPPDAPAADAHRRDRRGAAPASRDDRRLGRDRAQGAAILKMTIMDGGVRDAVRLPHLRFEAREAARRWPTWRSSTTWSRRSRSSATRLGVVAHRGVRRRLFGRAARRRDRARRRAHRARPPRRRRRRRALEAEDARRDSGLRLGLRPVRRRRDHRARIRPRGRAPSSTSCPPARSPSCPCPAANRASSGTSAAPTRARCSPSTPRTSSASSNCASPRSSAR